MTKKAGLLTGHDPARGSGLENVLKKSRLESSLVRRCSTPHASARDRSGSFPKSHWSGQAAFTRSVP